MWGPPLLLNTACLNSFSPVAILRDNLKAINALDFSRTGEFMVTSSDDESLNFYNATTGTLQKRIPSKRYGASQVRFARKTDTVIVASRNSSWDDTIRYLCLRENRFLRYFKGHRARVVGLDMSPVDNSFISSSLDYTVRLWDLRTNACQGLLRVEDKPKAVFDPRGIVLGTICGSSVKLYDMRSYDAGFFAKFTIPGNYTEFRCMKFSPDGKYIALSPTNDKVIIMDAFDGNITHTLTGRTNDNLSIDISFSPDGQFILSGSQEGEIYAWDAANGKKIAEFHSHNARTRCVMWNPRAMMIASGDVNGQLVFWAPQTIK